MNGTYSHLLPANFAPASRVWIYQGSRLFVNGEVQQVTGLLQHFSNNWQSHGTPVKGFGGLLFNQFIVLMADETATGVSGCSTDSSVRLMKELEQRFNVQLFDRQALAFLINDAIQLVPLSQVQSALDTGLISAHTIYFNNLVQTKEELMNQWMIPLKESWLSKRVTF
jgi:hypothetical protein